MGTIPTSLVVLFTGCDRFTSYWRSKFERIKFWCRYRGGRQTIDPPMQSTKENAIKDNDNVVKGSSEAEGCNGNDAEVPIKVILMPRPQPPFP